MTAPRMSIEESAAHHKANLRSALRVLKTRGGPMRETPEEGIAKKDAYKVLYIAERIGDADPDDAWYLRNLAQRIFAMDE